MVPPTIDLEITAADVAKLSSADAVAAFFASVGYRIDDRKPLTAESIGLAGEAAGPIRELEVLSDDEDGFLRVLFVRLRSLTAKSRNDLARVLGRTNVDHLLVLTSDFSTLEFVLLDKRRREGRGPAGGQRIQVVPLVFAVDRKGVGRRNSARSGGSPGPAATGWSSSTSCGAYLRRPPSRRTTSATGRCSPTITSSPGCRRMPPGRKTRLSRSGR